MISIMYDIFCDVLIFEDEPHGGWGLIGISAQKTQSFTV